MQHQSDAPSVLPASLVVSLTSYRKRFGTLDLTLRCLLNQSLQPDYTILWISHEDRQYVPEAVLELQSHGLRIRYCQDIKSYKKIIPTLQAFPAAFIATADDDVRYPAHWLAGLVRAWRNEQAGPSEARPATAVAWRAHRIVLDPASRRPLPYRKWQWNCWEIDRPSSLVFPTGVGGVLYPPGIFHPDVADRQRFEALCPGADDVWLYWMCRRNGGRFKATGQPLTLRHWPGTQLDSLWHKNLVLGNNDRCIRNMIEHYGLFEDAQAWQIGMETAGQAGAAV
ncbi:hypothetical protein V8Z80_15480 [Orrella sp. JC864]|uniref:hypothetical protein n=1 Tax=Orrella sp. JC864 TaxID=3120298 RepID=UPI00300B58D9